MNKNMTFQQQLFHYVEEQVTGQRVLDEESVRSVERRLESDPAIRKEAEEITRSLQWMQSAPSPVLPADLASRCLNAGRARRPARGRTFGHWRVLLPALTALLLVFLAGMWFGRPAPAPLLPDDSVRQLVQAQQEWVEKVRTVYAHKVLARSRQAPDAFQYFARTSDWLAQYAKMQSADANADQNTRQALQVALYQNILVLESLYRSLDSNPSLQPASASPDPVPTAADSL